MLRGTREYSASGHRSRLSIGLQTGDISLREMKSRILRVDRATKRVCSIPIPELVRYPLTRNAQGGADDAIGDARCRRIDTHRARSLRRERDGTSEVATTDW